MTRPEPTAALFPRNLYATDGRCHNAQRGTYGHECGEPAVWLGTKASGFQSGFCDRCRTHGDEATGFVAWERHPAAAPDLCQPEKDLVP